MRLWNPATGTPVGDPLTGHTGGVAAVARTCPTADPLATGGRTGRCGCGTWPPAPRSATR